MTTVFEQRVGVTHDGMRWSEVEKDVYERPCTGQEHSASFNQNVADGHTELSLLTCFSTSIPADQLAECFRLAWIASRINHPEIAIELSTDRRTPQMMTYRILRSDDELERWLASTLVICSPTADRENILSMTYDRRLPTRGKQSMMYFVPSARDTPNDPHCFIWNVSHAICDAFSIVSFINSFMHELVLAVPGKPARLSDQPEFALQRLPASLVHTYLEKFRPSIEDTEESIAIAREQAKLYSQKLDQSVAMMPRKDHHQRTHKTHCLVDTLTPQQSRLIMANLRPQKISITYAAAAATILAVRDLYGNGTEKGALLGMTRNARRWVDTKGQGGQAAIPMATDVVFLWIPFNGVLESGAGSKNGTQGDLLRLAQRIRQELAPHLRGPHYMASMQLMCNEFVDHLISTIEKQELQNRLSGTSASDEPEIVQRSPPGFSPQGVIGIEKHVQGNGHTLERVGFRHTGRQVNASPWIGMMSLDEVVNISIGFDEKYYEPEVIRSFFARYKDYLVSLTADEAQRNARL